MAKSKAVSRRGFLRRVATGVGVAAGFPYIIPASALGADGTVAPSNRITMGFIGLGNEGKLKDLRGFMGEPDVQVLALCDVHGKRLHGAHLAMQMFALDPSADQFQGCLTTRDWREVVARDDIDAICIATPDHWHVLPAVAGARAGKDVFLEKPVSLTIHEGRVLSDTMRLYGRVFRVGSEIRDLAHVVRACELVRNGRLGKLHTAYSEMYRGFGSPEFDKSPEWKPSNPPADFDYDMWLGPAPDAPFTYQRCHNTFRYMYDYGGGPITEWGPHLNDVVQWANNTELTGPVSIDGHAVFPRSGLYNTPTDFEVAYEYANGVKLICRTGAEELRPHEGSRVRFEGSDGWVQFDWQSIETSSPELRDTVIGPEEIHLTAPDACGEHRDFLNCVKSRADTAIPVEIGHRSTSVCHLGNISMRLGRKLRWDPETEYFDNDDEANRMLVRPMRSPWRLDA